MGDLSATNRKLRSVGSVVSAQPIGRNVRAMQSPNRSLQLTAQKAAALWVPSALRAPAATELRRYASLRMGVKKQLGRGLGMANKCKARLRTGPKKGKRCESRSKFSGYCGRHKYLLVEKARNASKVERSALISSLATNLIIIAEKTSEHWPEFIEITNSAGKLFGLHYPVTDPFEFNALMAQHLSSRKIDAELVLAIAKGSVAAGDVKLSTLDDLCEAIEHLSSNSQDKLDAETVVAIVREIEP